MKEIIGELIKEEVRKKGLTQEQFSGMMNMSLRTTANLFNKEHLPHDQLIKASKVLERDFIKDYLEYIYDSNPEINDLRILEEPGIPYKKDATKEHEISLQVNIFGKIEKIETEFASLLKVIKKEAENRGMHLG